MRMKHALLSMVTSLTVTPITSGLDSAGERARDRLSRHATRGGSVAGVPVVAKKGDLTMAQPVTIFVTLALLGSGALAASSTAVSNAKLGGGDLGGDCKPAADYPGSIHAGSSYNMPLFAEPVAKDKQSFECSGHRAAVFLLDFGTEQQASIVTGGFGARLWGGPGPSPMHPDELLVSKSVLAIVSGPGANPLVAALEKKGFKKFRRPPR